MKSVGAVLDVLEGTPHPRTVVELAQDSGFAIVTVRRAIWRLRRENKVALAQPNRRGRRGRAHYQYVACTPVQPV
ncbi:hypothetical protein IL38_24195 [Actinopolyspora erythraea]|uniref:HTH domain-containing protein n=1 Tax=Actinopolyspora erythraea TaxID=414996 RepID=A0ABR4WYT8_9ACTN|nr:hypothetical protein IL38_24195 [Actinopolyspora erythraea]